MNRQRTYVGIHDDEYGGMTPAGGIIKDCWVFGILPESETGKGFTPAQMQQLYDRVYAEWEKYGHLVSNLPPELRARHERIHREAVERARQMGWEPPVEEE